MFQWPPQYSNIMATCRQSRCQPIRALLLIATHSLCNKSQGTPPLLESPQRVAQPWSPAQLTSATVSVKRPLKGKGKKATKKPNSELKKKIDLETLLAVLYLL